MKHQPIKLKALDERSANQLNTLIQTEATQNKEIYT